MILSFLFSPMASVSETFLFSLASFDNPQSLSVSQMKEPLRPFPNSKNASHIISPLKKKKKDSGRQKEKKKERKKRGEDFLVLNDFPVQNDGLRT